MYMAKSSRFTFYGDHQLRNDGVNFIARIWYEILHTLFGECFIRMFGFRESIKKQGQVQAVVQFINVDLKIHVFRLKGYWKMEILTVHEIFAPPIKYCLKNKQKAYDS